jgi:hypothetical protein
VLLLEEAKVQRDRYRAAVKAGDQKHTIVERRKRKATDLTHLTIPPETLDTGFEPNKKSSQADKTEPRHTPTVLGACHRSPLHARPGSW